MRKASLSFGSSRWRALGKHSNKVLHWKAAQEARSSAWESIHGGMVSRPETEETRVYSSVPREACPNRVCIATLSRAASPSARARCPKRPIRRRRRNKRYAALTVSGGLTSLSRCCIQVRHILLIFGTDGLNHFGIDDHVLSQCHAPRPSVGLRIVHGKVDEERTEIYPAHTFRYACCARDGTARRIQPLVITITAAFHDQRVAFPMACRIAVPSRSRIRRKGPAVEKDLTVARIVFIEDDQQVRALHPLLHCGQHVHARSTRRDAARVRIIRGTLLPDAIPDPLLIRETAFDTRTNVSELRADGKIPAHTVDTIARQAIRRAPHSRQVRFSICGPWRRSIEIGLTVRCSRNATRRIVEPLRR